MPRGRDRPLVISASEQPLVFGDFDWSEAHFAYGGGHSRDNRVRHHVVHHDAAGGDNRASTNTDGGSDDCSQADPNVVLDDHRTGSAMTALPYSLSHDVGTVFVSVDEGDAARNQDVVTQDGIAQENAVWSDPDIVPERDLTSR